MLNDDHNTAATMPVLGSNHEDSSSTVQLSANTVRVYWSPVARSLLTNRTFWQRARLEKLAGWRIDPTWLKFTGRGPNIEGGYAIVSRALLIPSSDAIRGQLVAPSGGDVRSSDRIAKSEGDNGGQEAEGTKEEARTEDKEGAEAKENESDDEASGRRKVGGGPTHPGFPGGPLTDSSTPTL